MRNFVINLAEHFGSQIPHMTTYPESLTDEDDRVFYAVAYGRPFRERQWDSPCEFS